MSEETEKPKETEMKQPETEPAPRSNGGVVFSAMMQESKILKGTIDAVSAIIDETYLVADERGLTLIAMDESHICLMVMVLPKGLFDAFACTGAGRMGLNLEDMTKIMKRASANDAVEFKHQKDSEKFQVQMKGTGTRTFSLRLVEIDEEKIPPSAELDVHFDAKVTLDVDILDQAIKDAEIYQDTLEVQITKEQGVKFSAAGEVGDIEYQLDQDHLEAADIQKGGRGVFSLAFLKNILKISAITKKVTLNIAENAPLKFEFEVANPRTNEKGEPIATATGKVTYFLAPRVEEEESYETD